MPHQVEHKRHQLQEGRKRKSEVESIVTQVKTITRTAQEYI